MVPPARHHVVVVGGGFGGLETVKALRGAPVEVTLVDRTNHHLFLPLSYQVATAALSPDEVAEPLRTIFRRDRNVTVLMANVSDVDLERRLVILDPEEEDLDRRTVPYDSLVLATGSTYSYFGHEEWRPLALEISSLRSSMRVRSRILRAFEAAELEEGESRAQWLTFVVAGAGPTGVEMAGQIAELARDALPADFRAADPRGGRILLVERADRVLPGFARSLSARAARSLQELGVTTLVGHVIVAVDPQGVEIRCSEGSAERVQARTVVWAAGVRASPLAQVLADASGAAVDRGGRIVVEPDLTLPGHPEVLAIGDLARPGGADLPGLAPVAMQQGRYAGRLIARRLSGEHPARPFRYLDKGMLATIGRFRAVAELRGLRIGGPIAWLIWLVVHLVYLIGFENRMVVLLRWAYAFLTRNRGARVIAT